ncbi:MAG TPA: DPP IV N-terminal domain-containing protein, partial [Bacteroidales bacterium]|nr:DPP IV N-terminal domain-containing protein [Bacteroidales bacterium]
MTNKLRFCYFIGLIILVSGSLAFGQDKRLTIEDASYMSPRLNPANLSQLQWIPGTGEFVFVVGNSLVKGSVTSPVNDTLLRLTHINRLLKGLNEDTLKRYPQITMESGGIYTFSSGNALFQGDLAGQSLKKINSWVKEAENQDIDRNNHRVAYTRENNLFISENGREIAVTQELNKGIVYGSERVHRNEFGIDKGTFWSPTGNYLAFYRMDERRVTDYPLVDISATPAAFVPVKYPMAGMTSHKVTVGVYTPSTGKIVYLDTRIAGGSDSIEYLTNVTWSPDEKYIYIAC